MIYFVCRDAWAYGVCVCGVVCVMIYFVYRDAWTYGVCGVRACMRVCVHHVMIYFVCRDAWA